MGMRITKMMGYALIDLEYDERIYEHVDPRLNLDVVNNAADFRQKSLEFYKWANPKTIKKYAEEEMGLEGYVVDFTEDSFGMQGRERDPSEKRPMMFYGNHSEQLPNVLLFQPFLEDRWTRYADDIDSYEVFVHDPDRPYPKVYDLTQSGCTGIWPYDSVMLRRKGMGVDPEFLESLSDCEREVYLEAIEKGHYDSEMYSNRLKYGTPQLQKDLRENWFPRVEYSIPVFAHYMNIFKNHDTVHTLKPVIIIFWS